MVGLSYFGFPQTSEQYSGINKPPDYSGQIQDRYFSNDLRLRRNEHRLEKLLKDLKEQKNQSQEILKDHSDESIHDLLRNAPEEIKEGASQALLRAPEDKRSEGPLGPIKSS